MAPTVWVLRTGKEAFLTSQKWFGVKNKLLREQGKRRHLNESDSSDNDNMEKNAKGWQFEITSFSLFI